MFQELPYEQNVSLERAKMKGNASALQRVCDRYTSRKTGGAVRVHDTDGCRVSCVRIDRVSEACRDILSTARLHWPPTS